MLFSMSVVDLPWVVVQQLNSFKRLHFTLPSRSCQPKVYKRTQFRLVQVRFGNESRDVVYIKLAEGKYCLILCILIILYVAIVRSFIFISHKHP